MVPQGCGHIQLHNHSQHSCAQVYVGYMQMRQTTSAPP
jgi:hypothetical protein